MKHRSLACLVVGTLILAIGGVHAALHRRGHIWGGDFAQYVHHAKNLVEGIPYAETGYLYNPDYPQIGPPTYPPGVAVVLAPVYWAAGLDLEAMKWVMIPCFLLFLLAVYLCFRDELPLWGSAALVAVLGLNHFFLEDTSVINSDMPFLALLYLAILLVRRGETTTDDARRRMVYYLAAGLTAYLAYGTRSLGALLMPAVLLADLVRHRKITLPVILACALFGCLLLVQTGFFHSDASYLDQFDAPVSVLAANAFSYAKQLATFWHNGYVKPISVVLFAAVSWLAVLGYSASLRRIGTCEIFVVVYLVVILLWPSYQGIRYLYPILPLYLFYALKGLERPWIVGRPALRRAAPVCLGVAIGLSYATMLTALERGPYREGVAKPESVALFDYIRRNTAPDAVVIFIKPRVMSLLGERASSVYHRPEPKAEFWDYLDRIGADYVVVVENDKALAGLVDGPDVLPWLRDFVAENPSRLKRVWSNADFTVYRTQKSGV